MPFPPGHAGWRLSAMRIDTPRHLDGQIGIPSHAYRRLAPPGYADWHPSPARTGNLLAIMELRCEARTPPPAITRNLRGRAYEKWSCTAIVNGSAAQNGGPRRQTPGLLLWKPENRPANPFTIAVRDHPDNDFSRRSLARGVDGPIATACGEQRSSSRPVAACTRSPVAAACGEQRSSTGQRG